MVRKISVKEWEKTRGISREDPMKTKDEVASKAWKVERDKGYSRKEADREDVLFDPKKLANKTFYIVAGSLLALIILGLIFDWNLFVLVVFGAVGWNLYKKYKKGDFSLD